MTDEPIFTCVIPSEAFAMAASGVNRWPQSPPLKIFWHSEGGVGRVSALDFRGIIPHGLIRIERKTQLRFEYSPNPKTAQILYREARLGEGGMGQPGLVLADMLLVPPGLRVNADFQVLGRFDPREEWTSADDLLNGRIPMPGVVAHETGHGIGLGHAPQGSSDLMAPSIARGVTDFGQWSLSEFRKRGYGEAVGEPVPTPDGGDVWDLRFQGGVLSVKKNGILQRVTPSPFSGN